MDNKSNNSSGRKIDHKSPPRPYVEFNKAALPIPKIVRLLKALQKEPLTISEMSKAYGCSEKRLFPTLKQLKETYKVVITPLAYLSNNTTAEHGTPYKLESTGVFNKDLDRPSVSKLIREITGKSSPGRLPINTTLKMLKLLKESPKTLDELVDELGIDALPNNLRRYVSSVSKYCLIDIEVKNSVCTLNKKQLPGVFAKNAF